MVKSKRIENISVHSSMWFMWGKFDISSKTNATAAAGDVRPGMLHEAHRLSIFINHDQSATSQLVPLGQSNIPQSPVWLPDGTHLQRSYTKLAVCGLVLSLDITGVGKCVLLHPTVGSMLRLGWLFSSVNTTITDHVGVMITCSDWHWSDLCN